MSRNAQVLDCFRYSVDDLFGYLDEFGDVSCLVLDPSDNKYACGRVALVRCVNTRNTDELGWQVRSSRQRVGEGAHLQHAQEICSVIPGLVRPTHAPDQHRHVFQRAFALSPHSVFLLSCNSSSNILHNYISLLITRGHPFYCDKL